MEAHRIESAGKARENGTIDSSKHSHVKPPAKNPECEIANTPYLKVVGIDVFYLTEYHIGFNQMWTH